MLTVAFAASLDELHFVHASVRTFLFSVGCPEARIGVVELVCEELLVNSATHGQAQQVELRLRREMSGGLVLEWSDDGLEFDPTRASNSKSTKLDVGGEGLPLIKHFSSALTYRREKGRNVLQFGLPG